MTAIFVHYIHRITTSWDDATPTWQNPPGTTGTNQVAIPHTNLSTPDPVDIDVLNLVKDMQVNGNNGFMILLQNETAYTIRQFCSGVNSATTKRPELVVIFQ